MTKQERIDVLERWIRTQCQDGRGITCDACANTNCPLCHRKDGQKTIYTVTVDQNDEMSNVSFLSYDDAVKYVVAEICLNRTRSGGCPVSDGEKENVEKILDDDAIVKEFDRHTYRIDRSELVERFEHL